MSHSPNLHKADEAGLTLQTSTTPLAEKPSHDSLASEPFPTFSNKDGGLSRPSDVSTPASAHSRANPFDTDIEAIITTSDFGPRKSAECTKGGTDCQVWPGKDHWKKKAKAAKISRHSCNFLARMPKRKRIMVEVIIAVVIIGIAVGVGLGVSRHLGAGVWRSETQNGS